MKNMIKYIIIVITTVTLLSSCGTQGRCDGIYHPAMQDRN